MLRRKLLQAISAFALAVGILAVPAPASAAYGGCGAWKTNGPIDFRGCVFIDHDQDLVQYQVWIKNTSGTGQTMDWWLYKYQNGSGVVCNSGLLSLTAGSTTAYTCNGSLNPGWTYMAKGIVKRSGVSAAANSPVYTA